MNNRRVWDCIRAGGEVIVSLILFYRSLLWVLLIGTPLCFLQYRRLKRKWEQQHRWQLNLEFKEGLQGIAAALNAGYSIENAIEESRRDLLVVYGKESLLSWEFQVMLEQLKLNLPREAACRISKALRRCSGQLAGRVAIWLRSRGPAQTGSGRR